MIMFFLLSDSIKSIAPFGSAVNSYHLINVFNKWLHSPIILYHTTGIMSSPAIIMPICFLKCFIKPVNVNAISIMSSPWDLIKCFNKCIFVNVNVDVDGTGSTGYYVCPYSLLRRQLYYSVFFSIYL